MADSMIPAFDMAVVNAESREEVRAAINAVIDSDWFILGEQLSRFEAGYAHFNETAFAIGVANGLDALSISLAVLGIGPGDEVIVPAHTFIASALAVSAVGAKPVLADVNARTGLLDRDQCEKVWSDKVKAIMPVHLYGQLCEMDEINALAKEQGAFVLEDASQSHGGRYRGRISGSMGDIAAASLYPAKNLGAYGDAGVITTDNRKLAERAALYRNYGSSQKYVHELKGVNSRLSEIQAAVLSVKLKNIDASIAARREIARQYCEQLSGIDALTLPQFDEHTNPVWHQFVIRTSQRDTMQAALASAGIETLLHYPTPVHLQQAYADASYAPGDFPNAELFCQQCLSLPIYPGLTDEQIARVTAAVKGYFIKGSG